MSNNDRLKTQRTVPCVSIGSVCHRLFRTGQVEFCKIVGDDAHIVPKIGENFDTVLCAEKVRGKTKG